jgi:hypothetical protein
MNGHSVATKENLAGAKALGVEVHIDKMQVHWT